MWLRPGRAVCGSRRRRRSRSSVSLLPAFKDSFPRQRRDHDRVGVLGLRIQHGPRTDLCHASVRAGHLHAATHLGVDAAEPGKQSGSMKDWHT
jgi:hypothetical protein